jgi:DNA-binding CsgD family transcriptional regulator
MGHNKKLAYAFVLEDRGYSSLCWVWIRYIDKKGGYALMGGHKLGDTKLAHRYFYTLIKGPIPEGLELDHLCKVRCCVNPNHLEPVTPRENVRRSANYKITEEKIQEILDLRRNKVTLKDIASRFKIHTSRVEFFCRQAKVQLVIRLTKTQKKKIVDLRRNGARLKEIATIYKMNPGSVSAICCRAGVQANRRPSRHNDVLPASNHVIDSSASTATDA